MLSEEKTMKSERLYEGKIFNVRVDTVELPDMKYSRREIIEHPGSVAVVALTDDGKVVLVKQFRKALERFSLEIPAGRIDLNEEPRETALRELKEETGYEAKKLEYLLEFYPSPGMLTEKVYIFLATDLIPGETDLDDGEFVEFDLVDIEDLKYEIETGSIMDGKTIIAYHLLENYLRED